MFNWKPSASSEFPRNFIHVGFYQTYPTNRAGTFHYKLQKLKQALCCSHHHQWGIKTTEREISHVSAFFCLTVAVADKQ